MSYRLPLTAYRLPALDCLFIHVGKTVGHERRILLMPMGVPALADMLDRAGIKTRILNLPLAEIANPRFSLEGLLKKTNVRMVCMPLHWHQQTYEVYKTAKAIKELHPSVKIVLGGFTASFFHRQIIKDWGFIDFVVRGDAELPLLNLASALTAGKSVDKIPNLTWRQSGKVKINPHSYSVSQKIFDSLRYADFDLILNKAHCLRGRWGLLERDAEALNSGDFCFVYNPGRGCNRSCSFCGGSCSAQKILNRRLVVWKSPESVIGDLKAAWDAGVRRWLVCFDPEPSRKHFFEIFKRMEKGRLRYCVTFECWSLPDERFIRIFREVFAPESSLVLSLETGSDSVRRFNKGPCFTNAELKQTMRLLKKYKIKTELYFTCGLPGETMRDFSETVTLITELRREFDFILSAHPLEAEPLSPMTRSPKKFGVKPERKNLADYLIAGQKDEPGYSTPHMTGAEILKNARFLQSL